MKEVLQRESTQTGLTNEHQQQERRNRLFKTTIKDMKTLFIILFYGIFGCLSVSSQETAIFQILKIKRIENGCYKLTAKKNGEKYTIYTHYVDEDKNNGEKIQLNEDLELTIIPFFETKQMPLSEFKNGMGLQVNSEDSTRLADVTLPFNYQFINIDYYGNILKVKKKMLYYTSDINGVYKRK